MKADYIQMERLISVNFLQDLEKFINGRIKGRQGNLNKVQATELVPTENPVV